MTYYNLAPCIMVIFLITHAGGTIPAESSTAATSSECYSSGTNHAPACPTGSQIAITSYHDGFKAASDNCTIDGTATGTCCTYDVSGDCLQEAPTESRYVDEFSGRDSGIISTSNVSPTPGGPCVNDYSPVSVFSELKYICIPDTRVYSVCSKINSNRNSLPLYLQNRNYPDGILNSDTSCTCSVEAISGGSIDMYIVHMDLNGTPGNCRQTLNITNINGTELKIFNCENKTYNSITNESFVTNYIEIELTNSDNVTNAGKFWLGFAGANDADIAVTCPPPAKCGDPPEVDNGNVEYISKRPGGTVNYTCIRGYNMTSGDDVRYCGSDGTWNGTLPTCTLVDCGTPTLDNGIVSTPSGTTYNQRAEFSCNLGYTLDGHTSTYCLETGQWNASSSCVVKVCSDLPEITNGNIAYEGSKTFGSNASYSCGIGFTIFGGDATRTCQADQSWSGTEPTCSPVDCGTPTLDNGRVSTPSGTTYNQRAEFSCNTGYTLDGHTSAYCLETGQWNASASCTIVDARVLQPCTSSSSSNSLPLYIQNRNYPDGILTTDTSCTCSVETISGGSIDMYIVHMDLYDTPGDCQQTLNITDVDGSVLKTFNCDNEEFNVIKNETLSANYIEIELTNNFMTTNAGKFWLGFQASEQEITITCPPKPKDCLSPVPENGYSSGVDTSSGSVLAIICQPGYILSGSAAIICRPDGSWNDTVNCSVVDCGGFAVPDGIVNTPQGTVYNSLALITCNPGFTLNGNNLMTCQDDGSWSQSPTCDIKDCGDPTPTFGSVNGSAFTFNSTVTITCQRGFTLTGPEHITCLDDGQWSDTVACDIIDTECISCIVVTSAVGGALVGIATTVLLYLVYKKKHHHLYGRKDNGQKDTIYKKSIQRQHVRINQTEPSNAVPR